MAQYIRQQDHEEVERPSSPTSEVIFILLNHCNWHCMLLRSGKNSPEMFKDHFRKVSHLDITDKKCYEANFLNYLGLI